MNFSLWGGHNSVPKNCQLSKQNRLVEVAVHEFTQEMFIKHSLCAIHCTRHWRKDRLETCSADSWRKSHLNNYITLGENY